MRRAHLRERTRVAKISSAFKTIGNATTVIWLRCSTRKSGGASKRASRNCATRSRRMRNGSRHTVAYDRIKQAQAETAKNPAGLQLLRASRGRPRLRLPRAARVLQHALQICAPAPARRRRTRRNRTANVSRNSATATRESLELDLFSTEPVHDDVEIRRLTDSLTDLATAFGADDPLVQKVLAGQIARRSRAELVNGTKLKDAAVRKQLYAGGAAAVAAAHDPMIELARMVDGAGREARKDLRSAG